MSIIEFAAKSNDHGVHNFNDSNQVAVFAHKPDTLFTFTPGKPRGGYASYSKAAQYGHYISSHDMRHQRLGHKLQVLYDTNSVQLGEGAKNHHGAMLLKLEQGKKSARPIRGAKNIYTS